MKLIYVLNNSKIISTQIIMVNYNILNIICIFFVKISLLNVILLMKK